MELCILQPCCCGLLPILHPSAHFSDPLPPLVSLLVFNFFQPLAACAAAAAGFFGFVLRAEVRGRLYRANYRHMAHFTLLLVLFSAAAYKSEVSLLCC